MRTLRLLPCYPILVFHFLLFFFGAPMNYSWFLFHMHYIHLIVSTLPVHACWVCVLAACCSYSFNWCSYSSTEAPLDKFVFSFIIKTVGEVPTDKGSYKAPIVIAAVPRLRLKAVLILLFTEAAWVNTLQSHVIFFILILF